jgi:hypothetical protein
LGISGLPAPTLLPGSLAHVKLIIALEEAFGAKFRIDQLATIKSTSELQQVLAATQCQSLELAITLQLLFRSTK